MYRIRVTLSESHRFWLRLPLTGFIDFDQPYFTDVRADALQMSMKQALDIQQFYSKHNIVTAIEHV